MGSHFHTASQADPSLPDSLHISQLCVRLPIGIDLWERTSAQPVNIDIQVHTDVSQAGKSDHLPYSIHYGILVKEVEKHCEEAAKENGKRYRSLEELAEGIAKVCLFVCKASKVTLKVQKPRSLLHAKAAAVEITRIAQDFHHATGKPATHGDEIADLASLSLSPKSGSAIEDKIVIEDLLISTILGVNPGERVDKQVVRINVTAFTGLDRLQNGPSYSGERVRPQNYRTIAKTISDHVEKTAYKTVESLALSIAREAIMQGRLSRVKVRVDKPSAIMFADAAGCEVERDRAFFEDESQWGEEQQALSTRGAFATPNLRNGQNAQPATQVSEQIVAPQESTVASGSRHQNVSNEKAATQSVNGTSAVTASVTQWHLAAIALGSNLGDRAQNIDDAVRLLSDHPDCRVVDTSFLYDTAPMYYTDQPSFLNGACRIATRLSPDKLLDVTQSIEVKLGRDKTGIPDKGPRLVDLDIVFYDRLELSTSRLTIPHAGLAEREFVLRPIADILPDYIHPTSGRTVKQILNILVNLPEYVPSDVHRVMPIPPPRKLGCETQYWKWGSRTFIMGIVNATPDSFSDGGDHFSYHDALASARNMVTHGADILDIGGMSTAPKAPEISAEEEASRVVPVIQAIRQAGIETPISVDTFRASVARAALLAGANIVNDVTGGERDPEILDVTKQFNVPCILMHSRGDSKSMGALGDYSKTGGVMQGVSLELQARVERALKKGIPRWNIVLDPGIGFAKDQTGNLDLLRDLGKLTGGGGSAGMTLDAITAAMNGGRDALVGGDLVGVHSPSGSTSTASEDSITESLQSPHISLFAFPLLLGTSRKKFIGAITNEPDPKQRVWGTAATCAVGVSGGADILRVHDVKEMKAVALMADAIYRMAIRKED
ncbi:unnamed protein product [Sympodiomycopsis kandeliae]